MASNSLIEQNELIKKFFSQMEVRKEGLLPLFESFDRDEEVPSSDAQVDEDILTSFSTSTLNTGQHLNEYEE